MTDSSTADSVRTAVAATLAQPSARLARGGTSNGGRIAAGRMTSYGRCAFSVDAALVSQRLVDDAAAEKWNPAASPATGVGGRLAAGAVAALAVWHDYLYAGGAAYLRGDENEWQDMGWGRRDGPRPAANPTWMLYALDGLDETLPADGAGIGETPFTHVVTRVDPAATCAAQLPQPWGRPGRGRRRSDARLRIDLWIDAERRVRRVSALVIEEGTGVWDTVEFDEFGVDVTDVIALVDGLPPRG